MIMLVASIALTIVRGLAITLLWLWFIVPQFGVPELSIPVAVGMSILIGMFTSKPPSAEEWVQSQDKELKHAVQTLNMSWWFVYIAVAVVMGFIVQLFM